MAGAMMGIPEVKCCYQAITLTKNLATRSHLMSLVIAPEGPASWKLSVRSSDWYRQTRLWSLTA